MRNLCLTTALLNLAIVSPGIARPIIIQDTAVPTARVSYADLNLHSAAGRQALDFRVRHAANSLCFEYRSADLTFRTIEHDCYRKAIASARPQIDTAVRSLGLLAAATTIIVSVQ